MVDLSSHQAQEQNSSVMLKKKVLIINIQCLIKKCLAITSAIREAIFEGSLKLVRPNSLATINKCLPSNGSKDLHEESHCK